MRYKIEAKAGKLDLLFGSDTIMQSMEPIVRFGDGGVWRVAVGSVTTGTGVDAFGAYTEYSYSEGQEGKGIRAKGSFRCYDGAVVAFLGIESPQHWSDKEDITLEPVGGLSLMVQTPGMEGFMGNYLHKEWWTRPHFGTGTDDLPSLPERTQSLVWRRDGSFVHALAVCGRDLKAEFRGTPEGLEAYASAYVPGMSNVMTPVMAVSHDANPFTAAGRNTAAGLAASGAPAVARGRRRYPRVLEYLGWCTWDAFYQEVNEAGVMEKAEEFKAKGLPVKWFIIDDGWSDTAGDSCLNSFGAHPVKFPNGLAPVITRLKASYGLDWVGVWHAFSGYWNGIWPEGPVARENRESIHETGIGKLLPIPDATRSFGFWDKWHSQLKAQGVDFVKVDFQSSLMRTYRNNLPVARVAEALHSGLEASVGKNFDNAMINCMGMASENLWNRPISGISRYSDDFFPKERDSVSEHILQNAYNSFYKSPFIHGDWDMWWTEPAQGVNHGILRAISGGPVYVSDPVGTTDASKVWPLILSDGRILRCENPGLPTPDCLTMDTGAHGRPMKVWNTVGDTAYMAVFNVDSGKTGASVSGTLSPGDIPGLSQGSWAVYGHLSRSLRVLGTGEQMTVELGAGGVELHALAPVRHGLAVLGLLGKYIGMAAVKGLHVRKGKAILTLAEGGEFGFALASGGSAIVLADGVEVGVSTVPADGFVLCTAMVPDGRDITLEIDFTA